ncbi:MAG: acetate--CoA ligase family protein [Promethearchaeota archaeon]
MSELDYFFQPKSIAIIGASDNLRFGYSTTMYLLNSEFKTYAVNPKKKELFGQPTYNNIKDIPDEIELALILVRNEFVLEAVKDCVEKRVKGIIIESAGFAETGVDKYIKIQEEIVKLSKESNVRIIGPNCVGLTNFNNQFTTTEPSFERILKGGISVIAQSGVLGNVFLDWASSQKIGFSKVITLGNKIDIDEVDMLEYLDKDPDTKIITLYLEGTKRGKELFATLKSMSKPIIILKNGRSELGSNAVRSHTASLAGNDRIYDAIFRQSPGIFRVNNFYEMFNIAQVFSTQPLPKGKNIAVITGSGSLGILACDQIEKYGMSLARLSEESIQKVSSIIPNWVSINGTIDLGPSLFQTFPNSIETIIKDENVDCVLFIYSVPRWPLEKLKLPVSPLLRRLKKNASKNNKPCIVCAFGSRWVYDYLLKSTSIFGIPLMRRIKHAIKAFKLMYEYQKIKK